jgi:hypothetical protein
MNAKTIKNEGNQNVILQNVKNVHLTVSYTEGVQNDTAEILLNPMQTKIFEGLGLRSAQVFQTNPQIPSQRTALLGLVSKPNTKV